VALPGKEAPVMTGSALAPIVIPIVVTIALAAWLAIVFYAGAHPQWKAHRTSRKPGGTGTASPADAHAQSMRREVALVAKGSQEAGEAGTDDDAGRTASPLPRRAA